MRSRASCLFVLILSISKVSVAPAQDVNLYGLLPAVSYTCNITSRWDVGALVNSKINAFARSIEGTQYPAMNLELYTQAQVGFKIRPSVQFTAGYAYQRNNPFSVVHSNEDRTLQQLTVSSKLNTHLRLFQRGRFEQRFIRPSTGERVKGTRLRYQAGLMWRRADGQYYTCSNEFYFIPTHPRNAFYSENWLYVGAGKPMRKLGTVEVGLVYNSVVRNLQGDRRNLVLIQLSFGIVSRRTLVSPEHMPHHMRQF